MLPPSDAQAMMDAIRSQMPGIKSQAQLNAFMAGFDALRLAFDSVFRGDTSREKQALEALEKALHVARVSTDIGNKFEAVPDAPRAASNPFTNPPEEFAEYDIQKRLLGELEAISSEGDLIRWYSETKNDRDRVRSQNLRNVLLDAIRHKKSNLIS